MPTGSIPLNSVSIPSGCISLREALFQFINDTAIESEAATGHILKALISREVEVEFDHPKSGRRIVPQAYWETADADVTLTTSKLLSLGSSNQDLSEIHNCAAYFDAAKFRHWLDSYRGRAPTPGICSKPDFLLVEKWFVEFRRQHANDLKVPTREKEEEAARKSFPTIGHMRKIIIALRKKYPRSPGRPKKSG